MAMPCALLWWPITSSLIVADRLVILVELKQLWFPGGVAPEGEEVLCRIKNDGRDSAGQSIWQRKRVRERKTKIRFALFMNDCVAPSSRGANGQLGTWLGPAIP